MASLTALLDASCGISRLINPLNGFLSWNEPFSKSTARVIAGWEMNVPSPMRRSPLVSNFPAFASDKSTNVMLQIQEF